MAKEKAERERNMPARIELTWPDGDGHPMRIIDSNPVAYEREETIVENGKKVIKTTQIQYTACSARPATAAEVRKWRDQ